MDITLRRILHILDTVHFIFGNGFVIELACLCINKKQIKLSCALMVVLLSKWIDINIQLDMTSLLDFCGVLVK